jgi:hypothetical protein
MLHKQSNFYILAKKYNYEKTSYDYWIGSINIRSRKL